MLTFVEQIEVYDPEPKGRMDVIFAGDKIIAMDHEITLSSSQNINRIDGRKHFLFPGLVDSLVHITGGGGEGGFTTRTPEMPFSAASTAGVTSLVAALGTDATTRTLSNLLAKVKELRKLGLNSYAYTGSYQFPVRTLTENVQDDIVLIDEFIGVGEVAIADHRASQISSLELARLAAEARVGGMLSGKAGIVSIHCGDHKDGLKLLREVAQNSAIPASQFYPTHINRNQTLFEEGIAFARMGGFIDLTSSSTVSSLADGEIKCSLALAAYLEQKAPLSQITFSSDGFASLPEFDAAGRLTSLQVGRVHSLFEEFRDCVLNEGIAIEDALPVVTSNPADILKIPAGRIATGSSADCLMIHKDHWTIDEVWCKGKHLVKEGKALVKGEFEH